MKKFLFDLFPLFLFFIAYRYAGIYVATGTAMTASVLQILWLKFSGRPIEGMHWISLAVIMIFGGATLWLHNEVFFKWKPTVLYWLFGCALLAGRFIFKCNLLRRQLDKQIALPEPIWDRLNATWALFFLAAGAANLYVAFSGHFSEAEWVTFKAFGLMGIMVVFVIAQSVWLGKYIQSPADAAGKAGGDAGER